MSAVDGRQVQLSYHNEPFNRYAGIRPDGTRTTLHLDTAVRAGELAPTAVADALLDGARARSAAVGRRSDDTPCTTSSSKSTP